MHQVYIKTFCIRHQLLPEFSFHQLPENFHDKHYVMLWIKKRIRNVWSWRLKHLHINTVGTWYLWTTVWPTCVVKPWPHVFFVLETNQSLQNSVSKWCFNVTQRCENRPGTQLSTTLGHSGLHDPWGHQANISQVPPSSSSFDSSTQLSKRRSVASPAHLSFCSTSMEQRCSFPVSQRGKLPRHKLYQPSSRPAWSKLLKPSKGSNARACLRTSAQEQHRTAEPQNRSHKPARRLHWTSNTTSTSFPFSWTGNSIIILG